MNFYELNENANRYSVEVNYRTTTKEIKEGFAKLLLGYVSAALKKQNLYVKMVLNQTPYRVIVSNNNWIDGEWVLLLSYHPDMDCFVLTKGFYNKDRETVTKQSSEKCAGHSAAEIYKTMYSKIGELKKEPPHHISGLKGIKGKTGPNKGSLRPTQKSDIAKNILPNLEDKLGM